MAPKNGMGVKGIQGNIIIQLATTKDDDDYYSEGFSKYHKHPHNLPRIPAVVLLVLIIFLTTFTLPGDFTVCNELLESDTEGPSRSCT
jgi:hypothetical protein